MREVLNGTTSQSFLLSSTVTQLVYVHVENTLLIIEEGKFFEVGGRLAIAASDFIF